MVETECRDCMSEARMELGIYDPRAKVPKNLVRRLVEVYDDQHYEAHERRD